jgi:mycothiol system anti-sigma-R factor
VKVERRETEGDVARDSIREIVAHPSGLGRGGSDARVTVSGMITLAEAYRVMREAEGVAFECREVRGRLDAFVSGELAPVACRSVRAHLDECGDCDRLHRDMRRVRDRLRRAVHGDEAPDALREAVLRRLRGE